MLGINPHGVSLQFLKKLSEEEIDHEFLWRSQKEYQLAIRETARPEAP